MKVIALLSLFLLSSGLDGANILFLNTARIGQSHIFFMGKVADVLAEAGHNVTYYQQDAHKSVQKIGVKVAKYHVRQADFETRELAQDSMWESAAISSQFQLIKTFGLTFVEACKAQLNDYAYIERLRAGNWDLGVAENFDFCAFAIFQKIGVKKFIIASALPPGNNFLKDMGLPFGVGVEPRMTSEGYHQLTLTERLISFVKINLGFEFGRYLFGIPITEVIRQKVDPNFEAFDKLAEASYIFINVDEYLTTQTAITSKFVFLGSGLNEIKKDKKMDEEFQQIYDRSIDGVVVVSFGTVAKSINMPSHIRNSLLETFARFPNTSFIWKYEQEDDVASGLKNVHKKQWIPQNELLRHPRTLAFITHGGLNSISETAEIGIPSICTPLFADQHSNCRTLTNHGTAITLKKSNYTTENLVDSLNKLLYEDLYRSKAKALSKMISSKPYKSKERIIGYVQHALENEVHETLDLPERKLSFIQYYNIDYIVIITLVISVSSLLLLWSTYKVVIMLFSLISKIFNLSTNKTKLQ